MGHTSPHSKLGTLWRNRYAGGASYPYRHPRFLRQRRVSAWVASLATLGRGHVSQHATHPRGRHSSHTQDLLRLCTYAPVMPCPRCSEGGSNHYDGSNGSCLIMLMVNELVKEVMKEIVDRQAAIAPSRMSRVDKASVPPVWRLRALLRLLYDPSLHSVPIFGTPRHPNHRPSGTSALDTENEMYSLTSRLHLLLMPKSRSNKFEHDFWLKAVLTHVSETDSCVAVLSRTSAILPPNRLAALHIPQTENKVLQTRSVGHRGLRWRKHGVKISFSPPTTPIKPL